MCCLNVSNSPLLGSGQSNLLGLNYLNEISLDSSQFKAEKAAETLLPLCQIMHERGQVLPKALRGLVPLDICIGEGLVVIISLTCMGLISWEHLLKILRRVTALLTSPGMLHSSGVVLGGNPAGS